MLNVVRLSTQIFFSAGQISSVCIFGLLTSMRVGWHGLYGVASSISHLDVHMSQQPSANMFRVKHVV
jgi:hypothetical protein